MLGFLVPMFGGKTVFGLSTKPLRRFLPLCDFYVCGYGVERLLMAS
jgi:hypothetical protein